MNNNGAYRITDQGDAVFSSATATVSSQSWGVVVNNWRNYDVAASPRRVV